MMNRRAVLVSIGAVTLGATVPSSAFGHLLKTDPYGGQSTAEPRPEGSDAANAAVDEHLRQDLARLESRANSEEGVPVFLACIDLVAEKSHRKSPVLPPLNAAVTAEFRQTAAAWQRIRPKSTADDVAQVIVVLADRDFAKGGTEPAS